MKNRPLFLLFIISFVALCMFTCGCTAQDGSSATETETAAPQDQDFNPEEMPAGNMTAPEGMEGGPGGRGGGMDLAAAAETLGVTEDELTAALGTGEEGGQMDLDSAAATLGVTVEELQEALGFGDMPEGERPEGEMPDGTPPGETPA